MGDFTMPSLGADMLAGKISRWLVKPGDHVHHGDIVAVVQTDKSDIEVEIFENGTIEEILVPEGDRVAVGTVLAHVEARHDAPTPSDTNVREVPRSPIVSSLESSSALKDASLISPPDSLPASTRINTPTPNSSHPAPVESPLVRHLAERLSVDLSALTGTGRGGAITRRDVQHASDVRPLGDVRARRSSSPLARRTSTQLGVDLSAVVGSGPDGAILQRDVSRLAREKSDQVVASDAGVQERRRAMQRAVASLMVRSKREVPHYYLTTTIDLDNATTWLESANLSRPPADRLLMAALFFKATALAVKRVPEMNGFYADEAFSASEAVHLGIAVSQRSGGLIAPAIHNVDQITLEEVMARTRDLVRRARNGVLRASEMSDPTITVTNLGDLGVDSVFGVIYPPQVALVGFGRVREQPWAKSGLLGVRPCVIASLSGDHRVSDGIRGAHFLSEIDRLLQEPEQL